MLKDLEEFPVPRPSMLLELLADVERQLIMATLERLNGDKKQAAEMLGISVKTLYNRLNSYGETKRQSTLRRSSLQQA